VKLYNEYTHQVTEPPSSQIAQTSYSYKKSTLILINFFKLDNLTEQKMDIRTVLKKKI